MKRFRSFVANLIVVLALATHAQVWAANLATDRSKTAPSYEGQERMNVGAVFKDCPECPEMVAVPQVGHTVESPGKVFYVARYELTWREYIRSVRSGACEALHWMDLNGEPWPPKFLYMQEDSPLNTDHPVTGMRPKDFQCYVAWLKSKDGKTYRMPTGPEWLHFARAGAHSRYPWGSDLAYDKAMLSSIQGGGRQDLRLYDYDRLVKKYGDQRREQYRESIKYNGLWPVGNFPPNAWGLYDVIGNATEITSEILPPMSGCAKLYGPDRCRAYAGRGSKNYLDWVLKDPTNRDLFTPKERVAVEISGTEQGYRLVRD
jgi:hypothetical protein